MVKENQFTVYRFIGVEGSERNQYPVVTVRFDVDRVNNSIDCWWALCSEDDNFNREEGKRLVDKRASKDSPYYISFDYFPEYDLKTNFKLAVSALASDDTLYYTTCESVYNNIMKLYWDLIIINNINRAKRMNTGDYDIFDYIGHKLTSLKYYLFVKYTNLMGWA